MGDSEPERQAEHAIQQRGKHLRGLTSLNWSMWMLHVVCQVLFRVAVVRSTRSGFGMRQGRSGDQGVLETSTVASLLA